MMGRVFISFSLQRAAGGEKRQLNYKEKQSGACGRKQIVSRPARLRLRKNALKRAALQPIWVVPRKLSFVPWGIKTAFIVFRVFPVTRYFLMNQKGDSDGYKNIVQIAEIKPAQSD